MSIENQILDEFDKKHDVLLGPLWSASLPKEYMKTFLKQALKKQREALVLGEEEILKILEAHKDDHGEFPSPIWQPEWASLIKAILALQASKIKDGDQMTPTREEVEAAVKFFDFARNDVGLNDHVEHLIYLAKAYLDAGDDLPVPGHHSRCDSQPIDTPCVKFPGSTHCNCKKYEYQKEAIDACHLAVDKKYVRREN